MGSQFGVRAIPKGNKDTWGQHMYFLVRAGR